MRAAYETIHELALDQHGVFTTEQAKQHGVTNMALVMMAGRGRLRRLAHGVYQDPGSPETRLTRHMTAVLWPRGTRGVLSHETALVLMDLSDANAAKIHITVPKTYRTNRQPPAGIVLHYADLREDEDVAIVEGLPMTTAARTIRDCADAGIGPALLRQALADARKNGWMPAVQADALTAELVALKKL